MASLPPNATIDEIEEEISFIGVLIDSLDSGADDYATRLAELEANKEEYEARLSQGGSQPQTSDQEQNHMHGMDGTNDSSNAFWQTALNGRPHSSNSEAVTLAGPSTNPFGMRPDGGLPNPMKRTFPHPDSYSQHPSKRPTPEPSNAGTPTSSNDSFELVDNKSAVQRQIAREEALRQQRAAEARDEAFARSLQQQTTSSFQAPSSSRPNIQTTLNLNGSFQKPRPQPTPSPAPLPSQRESYAVQHPNLSNAAQPGPYIKREPGMAPIKTEPGLPKQSQLPQRPRTAESEVVDLTFSDDDDDDEIAEIDATRFTPNRRTENNFNRLLPPRPQPPQMPQMQQMPQMPGAYPTMNAAGYQSVYGNVNNAYGNANTASHTRYPWMNNQQNPLMNGAQTAVNSIQNVANRITTTFDELSQLINGPRAGPSGYGPGDDDIIYGGTRRLPGAPNPLGGYTDMDQYNERRAILEHHDPTKTAEQINDLLANIRPDEELPAHLKVTTPEAMAVRLHKYQELGLTWLKTAEESKNKGGILADDMGLGKTIQMLALMVERRSEDPRCRTTLIVAPVALMRQWKQEIEQKIRPGRHSLTVFTHHGQSKAKTFAQLRQYDVVLTTFGSLAAELKRLESFTARQIKDPGTVPMAKERCVLIGEDCEWYRVILDEAQCIKNVGTQTAKAACYLRAKSRFCMTGTPMMNRIEELYSLIKFLRIKPYAEWQNFRTDFVTPLKASHNRDKAMRMLQTLCKAIMLRRTKESTYEGKPILVLPKRETVIENPVFSDDEKAFYSALEQQSQLQFNKYLRAGTVGTSYSAILVLLLRLRQAACHPHLIKDFGVSAAADVTQEQLIELAGRLSAQVVERIKSTGGNFECPVCYDAVTNPAIFFPCGHDTCSDCFARIADPANALRDGNDRENATNAKCPNCRTAINPKEITDYNSFKKVHMPHQLTEEERDELKALHGEFTGEGDDDSDDSNTDSDTDDDDDELDNQGNLKDFVVKDDESETESEAEEGEDDLDLPGPSKPISKGKGKAKQSEKPKSSKKGKGRKEKKAKKDKKKKKSAMTLAELKKLATRNKSARRRYMDRIRKDWISSAKIEKTMEALKTIMDERPGEKCLIFSQWTSLLDLLEVPIDGEGWDYRRYDGSMNAKLRGDAVDDFRDPNKDIRIMLVSLKAGNAGLNLNAANNVIILDPFWNPYIEEQAIDRAHRLGQTKEVKVQRILVAETVEDRIIALQEKKRALISEALDEKAGQNIARLGVRELAYLFGVTRNASDPVNYVPRR